MRLRDHPKMRYKGEPNWPPQWGGAYRSGAKSPIGEVGILKSVQKVGADAALPAHLLLAIEFERATWSGDLMLDDLNIFNRLYKKLCDCIGQPIREIGDTEIDL